MSNKLNKDQVLTLLNDAKEQAVKFYNPHDYMYPILLRLIQEAYDFGLNDLKDLYGIGLQPLLLKEKAKEE